MQVKNYVLVCKVFGCSRSSFEKGHFVSKLYTVPLKSNLAKKKGIIYEELCENTENVLK